MSQYLSSEWFAEAQKAIDNSPEVAQATAGHNLTIQQHISGAPQGEVAYFLKVDDGRLTVGEGTQDGADVTIRMDYDTSAALNKGEQNQMAAFMSGKIKAEGNLMRVMSLQSAQVAIEAALRSVKTEY